MRVRAARSDARMTQGQVETYSRGRAARSWLSRIERGDISHPSHVRLAALAAVLGTTVEALVGDLDMGEPVGKASQLLGFFEILDDEDQDAALRIVRGLADSTLARRSRRGKVRRERAPHQSGQSEDRDAG